MNTQAAIAVSELAQNLHHPRLVILDCRYDLTDPQAGANTYRQSHIPGAHYASLHRDLSAPAGRYGGRHPLPSPPQFQQFARALGINADSQVVLYDDQRLAFAARAWWLLRYFGHEQVAILNGGFSAWQRAGLALAEDGSEEKPRATGNFTCQPRANVLVDHDQLYSSLDHSNLDKPPRQLIDARDALRYAGVEEPLDPIAGHIPTAVNKPWKEITDDQGMIKNREQLLAHWQDIPADEQLVNYCGSGVTACVNLFSLHLIGRDGAQLYPGSWSDWCAHLLNPVTSEQ